MKSYHIHVRTFPRGNLTEVAGLAGDSYRNTYEYALRLESCVRTRCLQNSVGVEEICEEIVFRLVTGKMAI